jgi:hypothetical protein
MPHARRAALTHARAHRCQHRALASPPPLAPCLRPELELAAPRQGAHMYFCGLKGMMPGILAMLEGVSKEKGLVWEDKLKEWKAKGQWHVEVY